MQTSIRKKKRVKYIAGLLLVCGLLLLGKKQVFAESGSIYTCSITTSYTHPVTGVIEDSGGEASAATGQGMAESAVGTQGILEVTDSGKYYLTVRFSLMDYASRHDISVQNVGDAHGAAHQWQQRRQERRKRKHRRCLHRSTVGELYCALLDVCRADGKKRDLLFLSGRLSVR